MASPSRCLVADLGGVEPGASMDLDAGARHHLDHVRRLRTGDPVELRDGHGGAARASWQGSGRLRIESVEAVEPPPAAPLWLAVAPPRLPRLEWLIEKATELGVARLLLLDTAFARRELRPTRLDRLQRKADSALLQCGRRHAMSLSGPLPLERALAEAGGATDGAGAPAPVTLWLADPDADAPPPATRPTAPLLALVGPEGGFRQDESVAIRAAGARPVRLGPHVLRVETAALALAAWAAACAIQD